MEEKQANRDSATAMTTPNGSNVNEKSNFNGDAIKPVQPSSEQHHQPDSAQRGDAATNIAATDPEKREHSTEEPKSQGPPGGYDSTPIPHAPPGYRVKITFHRASALPIADLVNLSSDPYLFAELVTDLPTRHKEDPILRFRSRTLWSTTDPLWNEQWIIDHIPASGFSLKVRIYDEDTGDSDDRLGNVHVSIPRIDEQWPGIKNQPYKIKKRMGSKRAYLLRAIAVCMHAAEEMSGRLYVSVEVLGKSPGDEGGRAYTVGLNYWCKHYAPLLGRLTGSKTGPEDDEEEEDDEYEDDNYNDRTPIQPSTTSTSKPTKPIKMAKTLSKKKPSRNPKRISRYNFQANQIQLTGPPPAELYHRYVEFRPFIKALFTASGIRGIILQKGLHHQHAQVYNFNRDTKYGVYRDGPCTAMTEKFLELCHYAEGGRIFTYVLTLDALMRFTETGKEFGIDLLSKHTMHSDASIYIAYSGEFFIRRIKPSHRHGAGHSQTTSDAREASDFNSSSNSSTPGATSADRPTPTRNSSGGSPRDPAYYELVIDNDSGTYRPNGTLLPLLNVFLSKNFPGLKIVTLDSQRDEKLMKRLKQEQRDRKRQEGGDQIVYTQISASSSESSISSSDEETLERRVEDQMLERRAREQEGAGDGIARVDNEHGVGGPGEPKHRLGEAILPFIDNKKMRRKLHNPAAAGASTSAAATATATAGEEGSPPGARL